MKQSLKQQLAAALADLERQRRLKGDKAEDDLKTRVESQINMTNARFEREREKPVLLFEIIRWMVRPENSTEPFDETERKEQPTLLEVRNPRRTRPGNVEDLVHDQIAKFPVPHVPLLRAIQQLLASDPGEDPITLNIVANGKANASMILRHFVRDHPKDSSLLGLRIF